MKVSLFSTSNFHFILDLDRACIRVHGASIFPARVAPALDDRRVRVELPQSLWREGAVTAGTTL